MNEETRKEWSKVRGVILVLGIILVIFFVGKTIATFKGLRTIGRDAIVNNTITVAGKGEVLAKPDIATVTFSVIEEGATAEAAQTKATAKINKVYEYLKAQKIDEKDIKTANYSVNPRYDYVTPSTLYRDGRRLLGYEAVQSFEVKIRSTDNAGTVLSGVGKLGVSQISGLNLTVDNEEELQKEAREKAIEDARQDAESLAKALGVRLVRIVNFSESGNYPGPCCYAAFGKASDAMEQSAPPVVPTGENKIVSNVTITYEIR